MNRKKLDDEYFQWLCRIVTDSIYAPKGPMTCLLQQLYDMKFSYINHMDYNRAVDGLELRYDYDPEFSRYNKSPCSVLEMLIALSKKCEGIAGESNNTDRTAYWFWMMIDNMSLTSMIDKRYNSIFP